VNSKIHRTVILIFLITHVVAWSGCSGKEDWLNQEEEIQIKGEHPNILLIIADDMGLDATPGYAEGERKPSMPNLDQLAAEGITFDNAWAYPLCSPTRASILTGKYGSRTGILSVEGTNIASSEISIQRYLSNHAEVDYAHAHIGKWHLSQFNQVTAPNDMGIDYFAGIMQGGVTDYYSWTLVTNGQSEACNDYHTTKMTDLSIEWINQQTKPWFCWLAYSAPHTPFHYPPSGMHSQNEAENTDLSMYLAMCESIDYEMGRLFDAMDQNTMDNTLIIFVGDNGTDKEVLQLPYRGRRAKGSLYQGGIHVPLIVSGKGVTRRNERDDNLISTTDLFATIADIAGAGISVYEDSYSFKELLTNETSGLRPYNFSEIDPGGDYRYAISDGTYKLISNNDKEDELYKLSDDPYEKTNLYNSTDAEDISAIQRLTLEAEKIIK
jgi:arylsulfatase A-like enzyme